MFVCIYAYDCLHTCVCVGVVSAGKGCPAFSSHPLLNSLKQDLSLSVELEFSKLG